MGSVLELGLILSLSAAIAYWWDTTRCNEIAAQHCRRMCETSAVQLLDSSVSRQRIWVRRNENGRVELCRLYSFEFSGDSQSRHFGYVVLLGRHVAETSMDAWRLPQ
jgi:hypothetical protein